MFALLLHANWREILSHDMDDLVSSARHRVVAMPQYLWVGNLSHVLCTSELDRKLPHAAALFGCPNRAACNCTPAHNHGPPGAAAHANPVDWKGAPTTAALRPHQLNLSEAACSLVREHIYARDFELWKGICGAASQPNHE